MHPVSAVTASASFTFRFLRAFASSVLACPSLQGSVFCMCAAGYKPLSFRGNLVVCELAALPTVSAQQTTAVQSTTRPDFSQAPDDTSSQRHAALGAGVAAACLLVLSGLFIWHWRRKRALVGAVSDQSSTVPRHVHDKVSWL